MAPPSNSSWWDTPCSLLIRPCCPLPRMSGRSVGRQFCTLDLSCCEDGSGYLSFAVLSSLPSCRLFPFRNVTPNVRNHPRARGGAQLRVRPSLSLSQVARICVRIVFRSCRWDLHLVTESRIRCTDRTMSTCPSLPLAQAGKVRRMLTISTRVD